MSIWVLHLPHPEQAAVPAGGGESLLPLSFIDLPGVLEASFHTEVQQRLRELHPDATPESLARRAQLLWSYAHSLSPEDILVVPLPASGEVAFAEVLAPVRTEGEGESQRYAVLVRWFERRVPLTRFGGVRSLLKPAHSALVEVEEPRARAAIRARLPLKANRFARWRWILAVVVAIQAFHYIMRMWKQ